MMANHHLGFSKLPIICILLNLESANLVYFRQYLICDRVGNVLQISKWIWRPVSPSQIFEILEINFNYVAATVNKLDQFLLLLLFFSLGYVMPLLTFNTAIYRHLGFSKWLITSFYCRYIQQIQIIFRQHFLSAIPDCIFKYRNQTWRPAAQIIDFIKDWQ